MWGMQGGRGGEGRGGYALSQTDPLKEFTPIHQKYAGFQSTVKV